jgi:hypothetical protein
MTVDETRILSCTGATPLDVDTDCVPAILGLVFSGGVLLCAVCWVVGVCVCVSVGPCASWSCVLPRMTKIYGLGCRGSPERAILRAIEDDYGIFMFFELDSTAPGPTEHGSESSESERGGERTRQTPVEQWTRGTRPTKTRLYMLGDEVCGIVPIYFSVFHCLVTSGLLEISASPLKRCDAMALIRSSPLLSWGFLSPTFPHCVLGRMHANRP